MATLALGLGGAAIGSFFGPLGASVGWALGAGVGNWISQKGAKAPELTDLRLQNASYGAPIPIGYGTKRISGNVIDQSDLRPHSGKKSGGKGGPKSQTQPTYTADVMVQLANTSYLDGDGVLVNRSIKRVLQIWADGRLIYGKDSSAATLPLTVYYGTEDQMPDPTFEALRGAGNVPAYRGKAYVVFTDWDLAPYGNRIPNLTFNVQFDGEVGLEYKYLWHVDWSWEPTHAGYSYPYALNGVEVVDGNLVLHRYRSGNDYGTEMGTSDDDILYWDRRVYTIPGKFVSADTQIAYITNMSNTAVFGSINSGIAYVSGQYSIDCTPYDKGAVTFINTFRWMQDGGESFNPGFYDDRKTFCPIATEDFAHTWQATIQLPVEAAPIYWNGWVYAAGGIGTGDMCLRRWPASSGGVRTKDFSPSHIFNADAQRSGYPADLGWFADPGCLAIGDGYLWWLVGYYSGAGDGTRLFQLDEQLNLVRTWWSLGSAPELPGAGVESFVIFQGRLISHYNSGITTSAFEPAFRMYDLNADGSMTFVDDIELPDTPSGFSGLYYIGNAMAALRGGILGLGNDFITLAEIVADISRRCGYSSSEYDVSALTDIVKGYVIGDRMTGRSAIDALRPTYQFGAVEANQAVKFRKWTGDIDFEVDQDDLGCRAFGEDAVQLEERTRVLEADLPQSIDFVFCNPDMDYQDGHVLRQRMVVESDLHIVVTAPIVLTPAEAMRACDILLMNAWVERDKSRFQLPYKYADAIPTDVVSVNGVARRIVNKEEQGYTHLVFDSVAAVTNVFVSQPADVPPLGFVPQPTPTPNSTEAVFLDSPLLVDTDSEVGFNVGMQGRFSGTWPSASLMKSIDAGATYDEVAFSDQPASIGIMLIEPADFTGGNIIDESTVARVRLNPGSPDLVSTTELGLLNGANLCAIGTPETGWEIAQYRDADLVEEDVYDLSGWLRGRRGSESFIGTHIPGETFVALPVVNVLGSGAELNEERLYKAVTSGRLLSSAEEVAFTNTGVALKPYAPCQLGGGRDGSGNVTLTWERRTRIGGAWVDNADAPLSEATEAYAVVIYQDSTYATPVWGEVVTSPEYVYTTTRQTTDFGSLQSTIYFGVTQIGKLGEGYEARGFA